jgi:hypothetical protein
MAMDFGAGAFNGDGRWLEVPVRSPAGSGAYTTLTPRQTAVLIRRGRLQNARFAAAVVVHGMKKDRPIEIRYDAIFPSLFQIRQRGLALSPISYATAHLAALFIKHFPREEAGVFAPGAIPMENRQAILRDIKSRGIQVTSKITRKKVSEDDEFE